jgi:predicted RNA-binding protein with TRAM domain
MEERGGFGQRRGGFRGRGPKFIPKPVETGREYEVDITEKSRRGEGIARIQGLVLFVPDTNPGDHVTVKIVRISSRFAEATVVRKAEGKEEAKEEETTGNE